jgi:hypothetical protein
MRGGSGVKKQELRVESFSVRTPSIVLGALGSLHALTRQLRNVVPSPEQGQGDRSKVGRQHSVYGFVKNVRKMVSRSYYPTVTPRYKG